MKVKQKDPCVIHCHGRRHPRLNSVYENFDKAAEAILDETDAWPKDNPACLSPYELFEAISEKLLSAWGIVRVNWYAVEVARTTFAQQTYEVAAENENAAHDLAVQRAEYDKWEGGNAEYEVGYSEEIDPPDGDEPDESLFRAAIGAELLDIYFTIGIDAPANHEQILNFCAEDVAASADPKTWHSSDVAIALRRFIETASSTL